MPDLHKDIKPSLRKKSPVEDISWDTEYCTIRIGRETIELTAEEYRVLFPLRHGTPVTYAHLARATCSGELDGKGQMRMEKRIESIRSKLRGSGISVYCIFCYGYILLPELSPDKSVKRKKYDRTERSLDESKRGQTKNHKKMEASEEG